MTEAVTEDAATEAEVQETEAKAPLERTVEEADIEASPKDRAGYKTQTEERYPKKIEYRKAAKENNSKPATKSFGLEGILADAKAIGNEHGIDQTEVLSALLTRHAYSVNSDEKSAKKANSGYEAREIPDSFNGGHVIIAYQHPETGELCFSFEKKPANYPPINGEKYAGKLSLYGGSLKIGESAIEGTSRELFEEENDRSSYRIIIKALNETSWKVAEINKNIDGVPSTTYVWLAYIKDPTDVKTYLSSKTLEGEKTQLTLTEMIKTKDSDFAFGFGPIVKEAGISLANRLYSKYN